MKHINAFAIFFLAYAFISCTKENDEDILKNNLTISINNNTKNEYHKVKLFSCCNVSSVITDSLSFTVPALSDTTIIWKPKVILNSEGVFQLRLNDMEMKNFGKVVGNISTDGYNYEVLILKSCIDIMPKKL